MFASSTGRQLPRSPQRAGLANLNPSRSPVATRASSQMAAIAKLPTEDFIKSKEEYDKLYERSISDPAGFWGEVAEQFHWERKWDADHYAANFDVRQGKISIEWFKGGMTNICFNALDRHVKEGRGGDVAFLWEGNEPGSSSQMTYKEVLDEVCRLANWMKAAGVKKGDHVAVYMPMVCELPIAMLACARIGAVHSVVFGGFSAESLAQRMEDCKCSLLLTCSAVMRATKRIELKGIADKAMGLCAKQGWQVRSCLVLDNASAMPTAECPFTEGRDHWWQREVGAMSAECPVEWVDSEHPLFLLYTSGSTGKPKGVLHSTGGYMVYAHTTCRHVFNLRRGDIYWCTADCGWITGHTYLTYGPLLAGATSVVFEGVPTHPDPGRCWQVIEKLKVTRFYTAPTAIRSLMRSGDGWANKYDKSSLRVLGTVGEPINPEAWRWYHEVIGGGKVPVVDTWWQTETGGHMITNLPGAWPEKPGSATLPFFGVAPAVLDEKGNELQGACEGYLVMKQSWPSGMRTVYGDHARFEATYFQPFPGYYFSGDGCKRDADGYYWITGRVDDVINVSGHRIGTAEVESALVAHPQCAEAAVVGFPHAIKGEGIYAYVTPMEGVPFSDTLRRELITSVREVIGAFAAPDIIHWAPALPKTRSGKIMRRVLRKIAAKEEDQLGDVSTLADPSVVESLVKLRGK